MVDVTIMIVQGPLRLLGLIKPMSWLIKFTFCCSRLLRFDQQVVLKESYLPDITPNLVTV